MSKVFLITGASTGIGAATARLAVQAGYSVVLTARSLEKLNALLAELPAKQALAVTCDVSQWEDQQRAVQQALEHFGRLDVVWANAGISKGGTFLKGEPTPEAWREMVLTNVYGLALTARATLSKLVKTQGHFLITSSVAGRVNVPGSLYSATKWAASAMAENIRKELVGSGVRVTLVEPGAIETPFWDERDKGGFNNFLQAEDVAKAVLFALSQPPHISLNGLVIRPTGQAI